MINVGIYSSQFTRDLIFIQAPWQRKHPSQHPRRKSLSQLPLRKSPKEERPSPQSAANQPTKIYSQMPSTTKLSSSAKSTRKSTPSSKAAVRHLPSTWPKRRGTSAKNQKSNAQVSSKPSQKPLRSGSRKDRLNLRSRITNQNRHKIASRIFWKKPMPSPQTKSGSTSTFLLTKLETITNSLMSTTVCCSKLEMRMPDNVQCLSFIQILT